MSYSPRPGTVAYRALAWLESSGPGREVTMSQWADAIGVGPTQLAGCVELLIEHGFIEKHLKHGQRRPAWFKLRAAPGGPEMSEREAPSRAAAVAQPEFLCWLRSDGVLVISRNGIVEAWSRTETGQLIDYLAPMCQARART